MGSPRSKGHTEQLLTPFINSCAEQGVTCETLRLYETEIAPCIGCKKCQDVADVFHCVHTDDMAALFERTQSSDLIIFATPIYSFFCTAPMKALLDRMIYSSCKYYGGVPQRQALLAGKKVATIVTCGYGLDKGTDLWETALERFCRHTKMTYLGMLAQRDLGDDIFMDEGKEAAARAFSQTLTRQLLGGELI